MREWVADSTTLSGSPVAGRRYWRASSPSACSPADVCMCVDGVSVNVPSRAVSFAGAGMRPAVTASPHLQGNHTSSRTRITLPPMALAMSPSE